MLRSLLRAFSSAAAGSKPRGRPAKGAPKGAPKGGRRAGGAGGADVVARRIAVADRVQSAKRLRAVTGKLWKPVADPVRDETAAVPSVLTGMVSARKVQRVSKGGRVDGYRSMVYKGNRQNVLVLATGKGPSAGAARSRAKKASYHPRNMVVLPAEVADFSMKVNYRGSVVHVRHVERPGLKYHGGHMMVRSLLKAAGANNVVAKTHRSRHPEKVQKALLKGLRQLRGVDEIASLRGIVVRKAVPERQ